MESIQFVKQFYQLFGARWEETADEEWEVTLTKELDKALMNRPFYWHYIEKMNAEGVPSKLTYTTTDQKGKLFIHAGSPHLHKLYTYTTNKGRKTTVYEKTTDNRRKEGLHPWLLCHFSITYKGITRTVQCLNIGIHLLTGAFRWNFLSHIRNYEWESEPSYYTYPIRPIIPEKNAVKRLTSYMEDHIGKQKHEWAERALEKRETEKRIIEEFHKKEGMDMNWYTQQHEELQRRLEPAVYLQEENRGIFYMTETTHNNLMDRK
ncbi:YqhG family protein [Salimicrobium halophilum]|uniref:Uncharacterized protein n=1 Tax=Salimicrobium halophilum TaxID=86666 RepID=A0A1G8PU81_9BACI|nr:YqhG family protein [Salimicrobium halophilum]SDI95775.1 protein YqhG of unknown function [Salimicrobium halophilum]